MSFYSDTFRKALSLFTMYRANDEEALALALNESTDPVDAGATIAALIKIGVAIHENRPEDLDAWLRETLLNIAMSNAE